MGILVASGAMYQCTGGAAPGTLVATSQQKVLLEGKPAMTVRDGAAFVNIQPCPACISPTHPVIAPILSVTGITVPQPCTPQTCGMWMETQTKVMAGGIPCLTGSSRIPCAFGGMITIVSPGQGKVLW